MKIAMHIFCLILSLAGFVLVFDGYQYAGGRYWTNEFWMVCLGLFLHGLSGRLTGALEERREDGRG
ncbi:MAG: hypothetical protein BWX88_05093 [Planctomycetes bacterium ADurb.Bin126]|nr:MAG: hypothetical protein BWX88_05093 [Planctomycetes bacterium ADurb.Bin126]HOD84840.1 hypothetical protein [Phycisphaerae bacterium]HQL76448.1 hypothetical protein [Phycisphaerae bacterium]